MALGKGCRLLAFTATACHPFPSTTGGAAKRLHPKTVIKHATHQILVSHPLAGRIGGKPVVGRELLAWTGEFLTMILGS